MTTSQSGLAEYTVRQLANLIGPERFLWGTEGPYFNLPMFGSQTPADDAASMHALVHRFEFLSARDKENILGRNAARLVRLDEA